MKYECRQQLNQLIIQLSLPDDALQTLVPHYERIAQWIAAKKTTDKTLIISINGAQGSGKSTLTQFVSTLLELEHGLHTVFISMDDFYSQRADRLALAKKIHPLLATRGVPGTHDLTLATQTLNDLTDSSKNPVALPAFDKKLDDRKPQSQWQICAKPVDVILFEGWCNHAPVQSDFELSHPINELETQEDAQGIWRHYVNEQLKRYHQQLFSRADYVLFLKIPSFEKVLEWRGLQEQKLRDLLKHSGQTNHKVMNEAQLKRFIQHFERITRHCLKTLPAVSDCIIELNNEHHITKVGFTH